MNEKNCKFLTVVGSLLSTKSVGAKGRELWEIGVKDEKSKITFFHAFPTSKALSAVFETKSLYKFSCFYDLKYPEFIKVYNVEKL